MSKVKVNISSVDSIKNELLDELNIILKKYDTLLHDIDNSKELFDTNTATYTREQFVDTVLTQKKYVSDSLIEYVNKLDFVKDKYITLFDTLKEDADKL